MTLFIRAKSCYAKLASATPPSRSTQILATCKAVRILATMPSRMDALVSMCHGLELRLSYNVYYEPRKGHEVKTMFP